MNNLTLTADKFSALIEGGGWSHQTTNRISNKHDCYSFSDAKETKEAVGISTVVSTHLKTGIKLTAEVAFQFIEGYPDSLARFPEQASWDIEGVEFVDEEGPDYEYEDGTPIYDPTTVDFFRSELLGIPGFTGSDFPIEEAIDFEKRQAQEEQLATGPDEDDEAISPR